MADESVESRDKKSDSQRISSGTAEDQRSSLTSDWNSKPLGCIANAFGIEISTLRLIIVAVVAIAFTIVFMIPAARPVVELAEASTIFGSLAAILCGLTWWHQARVRIGRLKLRYKTVRWASATVALILLSVAAVHQASFLVWNSSNSQGLPSANPYEYSFAIVNLKNDKGNRVEKEIAGEFRKFGPKTPIQLLHFRRTLPLKGKLSEAEKAATTQAIFWLLQSGAEEMLSGKVENVHGRQLVRLYETPAAGYSSFGEEHLPRDFELPELPPAEMSKVVALIAISESELYFGITSPKRLMSLIRYVRKLSDMPSGKSGLSADSIARLNFIAAQALRNFGLFTVSDELLRISIVYYLTAMKYWTPENDPLEWAMTERNLGIALESIQEREHDPVAQKAETAALEAALKVFTQKTDPLDWGLTKGMLAIQLSKEGMVQKGIQDYEKSLPDYVDALKVITRTNYPLNWIVFERHYAETLGDIGLRNGDPKPMLAGAKDLENILVMMKKRHISWPFERATVQGSLATTWEALGVRLPGRGYMVRSLAASRRALKVFTRQSFPLQWAGTLYNLGNTLDGLAYRDASTKEAEEALNAFHSELELCTRALVPHVWANIELSVADTLDTLGGIESDQANSGGGFSRGLKELSEGHLQQAIWACRSALEVDTRKAEPLEWAHLQSILGDALESLAEEESSTELYEQSLAAYQAALTVQTPQNAPVYWTDSESGLADVLESLGERENNIEDLHESVAAYRTTLKRETPERDGHYWLTAENNLGYALEQLGLRESGTSHLEEAAAAYTATADHITAQTHPLEWLSVQTNLGRVYTEIGERESGATGTADLVKALAAYRQALMAISPDRDPYRWKQTYSHIDHVIVLLRKRGWTGD